MAKQPIFTADIAKMISDASLGMWADPSNDSSQIKDYLKYAREHVANCLVLATGERFESFTRVIYEFLGECSGSENCIYSSLIAELQEEWNSSLYPSIYVDTLQAYYSKDSGIAYFEFMQGHLGHSDVDPYSSIVIEMYNMLKAEGL